MRNPLSIGVVLVFRGSRAQEVVAPLGERQSDMWRGWISEVEDIPVARPTMEGYIYAVGYLRLILLLARHHPSDLKKSLTLIFATGSS